jgi:hypothetical protein
MKRLIIAIALLMQVNLLLAQETKILGTGVVFAQDEFKNINVFNSNGSVYVKINQTTGGEIKVNYTQPVQQNILLSSIKTNYPYYSLKHDKYKIPLPKVSIRAFYPDENVVVFDAVKSRDGYKVFINGDWKIVKPTKGIEYQDWPVYMKRIYVKADKQHPLYKEADNKSPVVSDNKEYSYKVLEVKGDWIRVQCSQECEGCPENKILKGWMKWKENNCIIIDLFFAC